MARQSSANKSISDKKDNKTLSSTKKAGGNDKRPKSPCDIPYRPRSEKAYDLFEYAVKKLAERSQIKIEVLTPKMHNQWCNVCFGYSNLQSWQRQEYMSLIKSSYNAYFIGRAKYTFDMETIERDFPQFFEGYVKESDIIEMIEAVKSKSEFAKDPKHREKYEVEKIERQPDTNNIFRLTLNLNDDHEPHFYEGAKITLKLGLKYYNCEGIDYDITSAIMFVSCDSQIKYINGDYGFIYMDSSFILNAVYENMVSLSQVNFDGMPIKKIIDAETGKIDEIEDVVVPPIQKNELDDYQKLAYTASIENDVTFIWGPPGTGKSHTLASIIRALYSLKEKTLVCCVSNVAVDQLLNKFVYAIKDMKMKPKPGQIYRAGRTLDEKILAVDYLFPRDELTKKYRNSLKDINLRLNELSEVHASSSSESLILKNKRQIISDDLKTHTSYLIEQSYIVFSTIANFILTPDLYKRNFDNLIIDEASMLSMPYLIILAQRIFKRIILVGDPQQLGPISINQNHWLRQNIFDQCGVIRKRSPALRKLLVQRRSHPNIVALINQSFYKGRLIAVQCEQPDWVNQEPFAGHVVQVVNDGIAYDEVKYVGTTRRNFGTQQKVMDILEQYYKNRNPHFTIGVITPYRGQVKLYLESIQDKQNGNGFWESIKVGTIHAFQGSECDLVIIDLVEKAPTPVGKLFANEAGERLINVALSRARNKLIIVGDTQRFNGGRGIANVSTKVSQVLGKLR